MLSFIERAALAPCTQAKTKAIAEATGLSLPVAALLCRRGIDTPTAAKRFLYPGPEQLHDPFLLPDMTAAVDRIKKAVASREKITIFCDYDADGTTGGCTLYLHLVDIGADVCIMTPNRHKEGYGLNTAAVEQIAKTGSTLIVTVDCGITNIAETALAQSLGVDVVITDHHECGETLPDTPYIINAKRSDSVYPDPNLAGCGVAFKLIHALSSLADAMRYIDLVAVGTITDIVPLLGENRAIAYMGLGKLRRNPSAGLLALAQAAGISLTEITSFGISFGLGPRINAAGRMDTAQVAIDILSSTKTSPALKQSVRELCALNDARKKEVEEILADAETMIEENGYHSDPAIMLADSSWNAGVIGIAAAKITEKYTRPCVLFGGEGSLVGSARSIEGVNIFEALCAFADRYEKFGGHAQAAGLTIAPGELDGLRRDVCAYIRTHYDESAFVRKRVYDLVLTADEITSRLVDDLKRLEPFGQCNEKPVVAVMDAALDSIRFVGKDEKPHLKFTMVQNGKTQDAVAFCYKDMHALIPGRADFLCEAGIDSFSNRPQLIVRDIAFQTDDTLCESFLEAYSHCLMQGFLDEVTALGEGGFSGMSEDSFLAALSLAIDESRFGLCVCVNTVPAFKRLMTFDMVRQALQNKRLSLWDNKAFSPDNCIACTAAGGHTRFLSVGVKPVQSLFDEQLKDAYKSYAKSMFLGRDELLRLYRALPQILKRPRTQDEIARKLGEEIGPVSFALRVFTELRLLNTDISGRILTLKNNGPRKELRQSACYRGFEDLIHG